MTILIPILSIKLEFITRESFVCVLISNIFSRMLLSFV